MPYTGQEFESVWPSLVAELSKDAQQYELPSAALEWYQRVRVLPALKPALLPIASILSSLCSIQSLVPKTSSPVHHARSPCAPSSTPPSQSPILPGLPANPLLPNRASTTTPSAGNTTAASLSSTPPPSFSPPQPSPPPTSPPRPPSAGSPSSSKPSSSSPMT